MFEKTKQTGAKTRVAGIFSATLIMAVSSFLILSATSFSLDIPEKFNYQGVLLDANGDPLPDGEYGLSFSVWNDAEVGSMLWGPQVCEGINDPDSGNHPKVLVKNGEFHLEIGPKDTSGNLISEAFTGDTTYLQIEITIDKYGNTISDGVIKPRQQFLASPYAFYARRIPKVTPDTVNNEVTVEDKLIVESGGNQHVRLDSAISLFNNLGTIIRAKLVNISNGSKLSLYKKDGTEMVHLAADNNGGRMNIYNKNGNQVIHMDSKGTYGGIMNIKSPGGVNLLEFDTDYAALFGAYSFLHLFSPYGPKTIALTHLASYGILQLLDENEAVRIVMWSFGPYLGMVDENNDTRLSQGLDYSDQTPFLEMYDVNGTKRNNIYVGTNNLGYIYTNYLYATQISAGLKLFSISHPTKPGMKLIHACLEGPENAVYYRGEASLEGGEAVIVLPDYYEALTRQEGRTILLTCKNGWSPIYYEGIVDGKFKVKTTPEGNPSQEFSWEVKAVRADVEPLQVEKEATMEEQAGGGRKREPFIEGYPITASQAEALKKKLEEKGLLKK